MKPRNCTSILAVQLEGAGERVGGGLEKEEAEGTAFSSVIPG